MKIAVLASNAWSLVNFRGSLMREMRDRGHEVIAIAPEMDDAISGTLKSWGVRPVSTGLSRNGTNPFRDLLSTLELVRILRRERPDCLLSYLAKPVVFGGFAAFIAGVPRRATIITGIGSILLVEKEKRTFVHHLTRFLYRLAIPLYHVVFFQNPEDESQFREWQFLKGDQKTVQLAGSGVDLNHFLFQPLPAFPPIRFLMVGRLIGDKGVREYVEAGALMKALHPEVSLALLGGLDSNPSGVTREELDAWVAAGWVDYLGQVEDVRDAISHAHVVVLPSYREGTPRSLLEAMAMGRPLITTDVPGCREVVQAGKNGWLIPHKNVVALVQAMREVIQASADTLVSMGGEGRRMAISRFDVNLVNADILAVLELRPELPSGD